MRCSYRLTGGGARKVLPSQCMHINLSATDQYRVTNMIKWDKLTTAQRTAKRRERKKKDKLARANRRLQKIQRRGS